ncbi:hypothetical protein ACL1A3_13185, partial [Corynebacterium striatum]
FPHRDAVIRLVGAVLAEQHDEWIQQKRYMSLTSLEQTKALITGPTPGKWTRRGLAMLLWSV